LIVPTLIDKDGNLHPYQTLIENGTNLELDGHLVIAGKLSEFAIDDGIPALPPTVGPITFQLLWTEAERVAIDDLVLTDKAVANFKRLLDDPRTDAVVMALPSIQNSIETTLAALVGAGIIAEDDAPTRKAEILAGVMK
jgi:hypothetical protein